MVLRESWPVGFRDFGEVALILADDGESAWDKESKSIAKHCIIYYPAWPRGFVCSPRYYVTPGRRYFAFA